MMRPVGVGRRRVERGTDRDGREAREPRVGARAHHHRPRGVAREGEETLGRRGVAEVGTRESGTEMVCRVAAASRPLDDPRGGPLRPPLGVTLTARVRRPEPDGQVDQLLAKAAVADDDDPQRWARPHERGHRLDEPIEAFLVLQPSDRADDDDVRA